MSFPSNRYNPESSVREYCLFSTVEFVSNLDDEDRKEFFDDFKNSEGRWINIGSTWANFLRDYILKPSGCEAIAEAVCCDMMDYADTEDVVLDLLKELANEKIEAESVEDSAASEDEDATSDKNALANLVCRSLRYDDSSHTVLIETEDGVDGVKEVPLAEFSKIANRYKLTPPNTIGNNGKWLWRKTVAGKDYIKSDYTEEHKLSFV